LNKSKDNGKNGFNASNVVQEINHQLKPSTNNFPTCQQVWECRVW